MYLLNSLDDVARSEASTLYRGDTALLDTRVGTALKMAHCISERELRMLERDRRENCEDKGYRYIQGKRVCSRVVSERKRRKIAGEKIYKKLTKVTVQNQFLSQSSEAHISKRQMPYSPVRQAARFPVSSAASRPVFLKQSGQSTSTIAMETATAPTNVKLNGRIKAVSMGDICVKTQSDDCNSYITGSVLLPGHKLMLADYGNHKVKLVNLLTLKVMTELKTSSKPRCITSISEDTVVVTVPGSRKIAFVKVTYQLRLERELPVDGQCLAVLYSNGDLVVSCVNPCKIEIISLDGKAKMKIALSETFRSPDDIVLSQDNKTMYVSDVFNGCVTRLSLNGTVMATYDDKELDVPRGVIAVDEHGMLLVCGCNSHNIHLLKPDLTKIQILRLQETDWPQSLSYCYNTGRLYVGLWGTDNMKVYQLVNSFE